MWLPIVRLLWKIILNIIYMNIRCFFLFQVSWRRGAILCIGDAICDIPSVWVYPCTNSLWKLNWFNMSPMEEHMWWEGRTMSSLWHWTVQIQVSYLYHDLKFMSTVVCVSLSFKFCIYPIKCQDINSSLGMSCNQVLGQILLQVVWTQIVIRC
jgi:hypothetical protein